MFSGTLSKPLTTRTKCSSRLVSCIYNLELTGSQWRTSQKLNSFFHLLLFFLSFVCLKNLTPNLKFIDSSVSFQKITTVLSSFSLPFTKIDDYKWMWRFFLQKEVKDAIAKWKNARTLLWNRNDRRWILTPCKRLNTKANILFVNIVRQCFELSAIFEISLYHRTLMCRYLQA